jgi:AcrR family transcriptional regulator
MARGERREAIVRAAVTVMLREGFGAMTTRRVATELGAANGIIHHHFRTAAELKRAAFAHHVAAQRQAFDEAAPGMTLAQAIALFVEDQIAAEREREMRLWAEAWHEAQGDPELAAIYADAVRDWHRLLSNLLREGFSQGVFKAQADVEETAWRILGLGFGLSGMVTLPAALLSPAESRRIMVDMLARDLGMAI